MAVALITILSIILIAVVIRVIAVKTQREFLITNVIIPLIVLIVVVVSVVQIGESNKEYAQKKEEYEVEVAKYVEDNEVETSEDIMIRDVSVVKDGKLEFKIIMDNKGKYKQEIITDYEESSEIDSPYIEYVELKEDIVYRNKGQKIIKLLIPENYLYIN